MLSERSPTIIFYITFYSVLYRVSGCSLILWVRCSYLYYSSNSSFSSSVFLIWSILLCFYFCSVLLQITQVLVILYLQLQTSLSPPQNLWYLRQLNFYHSLIEIGSILFFYIQSNKSTHLAPITCSSSVNLHLRSKSISTSQYLFLFCHTPLHHSELNYFMRNSKSFQW